MTYVVAAEDAVDELNRTVQDNVEEERIEEERAGRCVLDIPVPNVHGDLLW